MQQLPIGHEFTMRVRVKPEMTASFFGTPIHPVYATFALVEHCEYAARQAIRPYFEEGDDAVGSAVEIRHTAPTPVGWIVEITARISEVDDRTVVCEVVARNRHGVIARCRQHQRIVDADRLRQRIEELYEER